MPSFPWMPQNSSELWLRERKGRIYKISSPIGWTRFLYFSWDCSRCGGGGWQGEQWLTSWWDQDWIIHTCPVTTSSPSLIPTGPQSPTTLSPAILFTPLCPQLPFFKVLKMPALPPAPHALLCLFEEVPAQARVPSMHVLVGEEAGKWSHP